MSDTSNMDLIDGKRIKLGDEHEDIKSFGPICKNSAVDCFKNKGMKLIIEQFNDKSVKSYNTFINTGQIF